MPTPVLRIERVEPRPGKRDEAYRSKIGEYTLGDPAVTSKLRKTKAYSKKVRSLDEAAYWIESYGWHIRMGDTWNDASLIEPSMVRVIR
jgi:hypothetical protein